MSPIKFFRVAPGGTAELAAAGVSIRDRSGKPLPEAEPADLVESVLVGMRANAPGKQVPGTRAGYSCRRCAVDVRLAPSGQGLAAQGVPTWCVECFAAHQGAS